MVKREKREFRVIGLLISERKIKNEAARMDAILSEKMRGNIFMNREAEYRTAYETKKKPEGVYVMNGFCSSMEKDASVKDIPDILRLYWDRALTCEQNEFVTEVLVKVVVNNPGDAAKSIIANIRILQEEEAEECFLEILRIFIYWYPQFKNIFMEELKKSDIENQKYLNFFLLMYRTLYYAPHGICCFGI